VFRVEETIVSKQDIMLSIDDINMVGEVFSIVVKGIILLTLHILCLVLAVIYRVWET
jgi:hypothetical protein